MVTLREWFRKEESAKAVASEEDSEEVRPQLWQRRKAMIKAENDTWSRIPTRDRRRRQELWKRAIPVVKAANKYLFEK